MGDTDEEEESMKAEEEDEETGNVREEMKEERDGRNEKPTHVPPMSTLICCIPVSHSRAGRKARCTDHIEEPVFCWELLPGMRGPPPTGMMQPTVGSDSSSHLLSMY